MTRPRAVRRAVHHGQHVADPLLCPYCQRTLLQPDRPTPRRIEAAIRRLRKMKGKL